MSRAAFAPCASFALRHRVFLRPQHATFATRKAENLNRSRVGSGRVVCSAAVDLRFVRKNVDLVRQNAADRGVEADVDRVVELYDAVLKLGQEVGELRQRRNANADIMKRTASKMTADERAHTIAEGKLLKISLSETEERLGVLEQDLNVEAARIPNLTHPEVPHGGEENATELHLHGVKRDFDAEGFAPRGHLELATALDLVDFENAARVAGNKFYYMRNAGALLELALVNWAMTNAARDGFTVMTAPDVARESVLAGCGFAPRGEASQVYRLADSDLCLAGTSEIALGGYYAGQIIERDALPIRMAAYSHCFRREVGAAGATTRGLYRVHQFSKVELFVIAAPDDSERVHAELRAFEERMFSELGLHYRVLDMPTLDLGNPAYRKIDIEAWMPGRGNYGEISSASNCTDYQARRLGIRYRETLGDNRYVHTLNATACAVPRMIVAILENFQRVDGSVVVPMVLRPFLGGLEVIEHPQSNKGSRQVATAGTNSAAV